MTTVTLDDYLAHFLQDETVLRKATAQTVRRLADAALEVREAINLGVLAGDVGTTKVTNAGGDAQKQLDVVADEIFLNAMAGAPIALYASEELDTPIVLDSAAPLAIAIDPLDGSSNIDTNVSIGAIFSLLPVVEPLEASGLNTFLQPGSRQIGAGFFVFGPQFALVLTLGAGTHIFIYSSRLGNFVQAYDGVAIPPKAAEFAVNASNYRHWDNPARHYFDDCLKGATGPLGHDYNMRWIASMVADAYRILMRGGVYLYPGDARRGYGTGRLRLVYEANPIAMVVEQAGGKATDCSNPILEITPTALHQRVPLVFGSAEEVERIAQYHNEPNQYGDHSPLFGTRGLFRS